MLAYLDLESEAGTTSASDIGPAIEAYVTDPSLENPTVLRWRISLAFVAGKANLARRDLAEAERYFRWVAAAPTQDYHAVLLTKPGAAVFVLACICLSTGRREEARTVLRDGYLSIKAALAAHLSASEDLVSAPFELNELGEVLAHLGRLSGALRTLDEIDDRSTGFAIETGRDLLSDVARLRRALVLTEAGTEWYRRLTDHLTQVIGENDAWLGKIVEARDWWRSQYEVAEADRRAQAEVIAAQADWIEQLTGARDWLHQQWHNALNATKSDGDDGRPEPTSPD